MASSPILTSSFLLLTITITSLLTIIQAKGSNEKLSHLHFYFHTIQNGPNPSTVTVVQPASNASAVDGAFGAIAMFDTPLTAGPESGSTLVGRAQGFYAQASREEDALLMVINLVFLQGKYNGSGLTIVGRNVVNSKVREMPVTGGSRVFRFARGYPLVSSYAFNQTAGGGILQYNVSALHY